MSEQDRTSIGSVALDKTGELLPAEGASPDLTAQLDTGGTEGLPLLKTKVDPTQGPPDSPATSVDFEVRTFGNYELLAEVARGGMGIVYKARQRGLNRIVALKMILDGQLNSSLAVQRFYQEAQAAAALDHPHIVPIYEIGEHEGRHFYAMAFVEGESLSHRVERRGLPPASETAALVQGIAEAVAFAHDRGIIHRDLKPDNVLIDAHGRPRVTDFGLAKRLDCDAGLTANGSILGTPSYMAPEQARGAAAVGPPADIYALGGILYFLLTGRPPFVGKNFGEVLFQVAEDPPVPPRQINPAADARLEAICLKCLSKDPAARYPSAAAVAEALKPLPGGGGGEGTLVVVPSPAPPSSPPRRRLPWAVVGAAAVCFAALVVAAFVIKPWLGAPPPNTQPEPPDLMAAVFEVAPSDFGLKVEMDGAAVDPQSGQRLLKAGQKIRFRIEVDRDAHVGIWTIDPKGEVTQLFPNQYEPDALVKAGEPRTVPNENYTIDAEASQGVERILALGSSQPLSPLDGSQEGAFLVFKDAKDKERWQKQVLGLRQERGLKIRPADQPATAEQVLPYRVVPRPR